MSDVAQVRLSGVECCAVRLGDTLGVVGADVVASRFSVNHQGAIFSTTSDASVVRVGARVTFDLLLFPYVFSVAAIYDTGIYDTELCVRSGGWFGV